VELDNASENLISLGEKRLVTTQLINFAHSRFKADIIDTIGAGTWCYDAE
jgi:hypothetical protein